MLWFCLKMSFLKGVMMVAILRISQSHWEYLEGINQTKPQYHPLLADLEGNFTSISSTMARGWVGGWLCGEWKNSRESMRRVGSQGPWDKVKKPYFTERLSQGENWSRQSQHVLAMCYSCDVTLTLLPIWVGSDHTAEVMPCEFQG